MGLQEALARGRMPRQHGGRPDRARDEIAPAIRAAAAEAVRRASRAEGALVGADDGVGGRGRQVLVAALAIRLEQKHRVAPLKLVSFAGPAAAFNPKLMTLTPGRPAP